LTQTKLGSAISIFGLVRIAFGLGLVRFMLLK